MSQAKIAYLAHKSEILKNVAAATEFLRRFKKLKSKDHQQPTSL